MATKKTAKRSATATSRKTSKSHPASKSAAKAASSTEKKPVRKASKLGRSRIPVNAPLEVIFEHDDQARQAFELLGITTIRELQKFDPDTLVMKLTSPTKQTVGRIRRILAMNNRCLDGDERLALDVQKQEK